MSRLIPAVALAVLVALAQQTATAAPKKEKRAYKPAERRQQAAESEPAKAADEATATTYEQELQAAREKRDKDLEDVAANETDRKTLDKRKQEIFSQYAAIVAALRDKYQATQPQDPATPPRSGKSARTTRKEVDKDPAADDAATGKSKDAKKKRNLDDALATAQEKLDEENRRHKTKLDQLNAQLRQANLSENERETRRIEKAIEKENNSYETKRKLLERRVEELGGSVPAAPVE